MGDQAPVIPLGSSKYENIGEMKNEIAAKLRRNVLAPAEPPKYDRNAGFHMFFDYGIGIPKKYINCKVVYGVYCRGEMIISPKKIEPHDCTSWDGNINKCEFNENLQVFDVPANMDSMIIFELQCVVDNRLTTNTTPEVLGWTMVDLFTMAKILKTGKWKLPVYMKPTNTHITFSKIKGLKRVRDLWIYMRLCIHQEEKFFDDKKRPIETDGEGYLIPEIHSRYWKDTVPAPETIVEQAKEKEEKEKEEQRRKKDQDPDADLELDMSNLTNREHRSYQAKNMYQEILRDLLEEEKEIHQKDHEKKRNGEDGRFNLMEELAKADDRLVNRDAPLNISVDVNLHKGIKMTIVGLRNFTTKMRFKISGGLIL